MIVHVVVYPITMRSRSLWSSF